METFIIIFIICIIVSAFVFYLWYDTKKTDEENAKWAEKVRREEIEKNNKLREYDDKYGVFESIDAINWLNHKEQIRIYTEANKIVVRCKDYNISDIIMLENESNDREQITFHTKTNVADMVKRGAVGGAIMGVPGAVIGALTSERITKSETDYLMRRDDTIALHLKNGDLFRFLVDSDKSVKFIYDFQQAIEKCNNGL